VLDVEVLGSVADTESEEVAVVEGDGLLDELQPARSTTRHVAAVIDAPAALSIRRTLTPPFSQA